MLYLASRTSCASHTYISREQHPHTLMAGSQPLCHHPPAALDGRKARIHRCIAAASVSRRTALLGGALGVSLLDVSQPPVAHSLELQQSLGDTWFPAAPQPVLFPRKALDQRFAVLLLRSGYAAVDQLDFIPMNKFQELFWKYRRAEQEGYAVQYLPATVRKGDVTDPLFFDFISYCQLAVAGREMPNGKQVFQELCEECEERTMRTVRRDPALADNALLPGRYPELLGDNVYAGLKDGFREEVFGAPAPLPRTASTSELLQASQSILDIMVDKGFAIKSDITSVAQAGPSSSTSFQIQTLGPANLWALSSLSYRRSPLYNTYEALTVAAFLRACGHAPQSIKFELTDTGVVHTLTLPALAA